MPSEKVIELRRHLREKFPAAHRLDRLEAPPASLAMPSLRPTPLPQPPAGTLAEITAPGPGSGLSLVLASLLARSESLQAPSPTRPLVLIDARDSFDPASFPPDECARILWVRCRQTDDALHAADLLLRDGNLPMVVLDLASLPERELRRVPLAAWHRLRQLAASTRTTLLALTPAPSIPCAQLRLTLASGLSLAHLDQARTQLLPLLVTNSLRVQAQA